LEFACQLKKKFKPAADHAFDSIVDGEEQAVVFKICHKKSWRIFHIWRRFSWKPNWKKF